MNQEDFPTAKVILKPLIREMFYSWCICPGHRSSEEHRATDCSLKANDPEALTKHIAITSYYPGFY